MTGPSTPHVHDIFQPVPHPCPYLYLPWCRFQVAMLLVIMFKCFLTLPVATAGLLAANKEDLTMLRCFERCALCLRFVGGGA